LKNNTTTLLSMIYWNFCHNLHFMCMRQAVTKYSDTILVNPEDQFGCLLHKMFDKLGDDIGQNMGYCILSMRNSWLMMPDGCYSEYMIVTLEGFFS
jgi:hypothetical protein